MSIPDFVVEACARAAFEANRAYCIAIGDTSHVDWDHAPDWQKDSTRKGVAGVIDGNTPEESHESWLREKVATGWTYGPVKDAEAKTHPCMLPYRELSEAQRAKDRIYLDVVTSIAAALGHF